MVNGFYIHKSHFYQKDNSLQGYSVQSGAPLGGIRFTHADEVMSGIVAIIKLIFPTDP